MLGAVTAGAAAALNTPSPSSARKGKGRKGGKRSAASASSTDAELSSSSEEEAEAAPVSIASKASAPGALARPAAPRAALHAGLPAVGRLACSAGGACKRVAHPSSLCTFAPAGVILAAGVLSAIDAGKRILEANSDEE